MINILTAYKNGLTCAWREKRLLLWLYVFNVLFAYLITLPVSMMLTEALDQSTAADKILHAFDFTIFTTIMDDFGKGIDLGRMILTLGILYMILSLFFAGGILKIFIERNKFNLIDFFTGCATYFYRFLRLFLISFLFVAAALLIYLLISGFIGLLTDNSATERLPMILFSLNLLIFGFILATINMLFDYAKIMTILYDLPGMIKAVEKASMFILMNLRKTIGLYLFYLMTAIILMMCYLYVESFISVTGWLTLVIFIFWAQLFMISRIWIRLSFFAGQYSFYFYANETLPVITK